MAHMLSCLDELFGFIKIGKRSKFNSILALANSFSFVVSVLLILITKSHYLFNFLWCFHVFFPGEGARHLGVRVGGMALVEAVKHLLNIIVRKYFIVKLTSRC